MSRLSATRPKMARMTLRETYAPGRRPIHTKHGGTLVIDPVRCAGPVPSCVECQAVATVYALVIPAAQAVGLLADWDLLSAELAERGVAYCHTHMQAVVDLWAADVETVQ